MLRPTFDQYFINLAKVILTRATCLRRKYGAIIVDNNNNVIISTGYNGAPRKVKDCLEIGYCKRQELNIKPGERYEMCKSLHGEMNAIINADFNSLKSSKLYLVGYDVEKNKYISGKPCMMCSRMILNAQIGKIITIDDNDENKIIEIEITEDMI